MHDFSKKRKYCKHTNLQICMFYNFLFLLGREEGVRNELKGGKRNKIDKK